MGSPPCHRLLWGGKRESVNKEVTSKASWPRGTPGDISRAWHAVTLFLHLRWELGAGGWGLSLLSWAGRLLRVLSPSVLASPPPPSPCADCPCPSATSPLCPCPHRGHPLHAGALQPARPRSKARHRSSRIPSQPNSPPAPHCFYFSKDAPGRGGDSAGLPTPSIPSIFPPHLSAAAFPPALPQEGNTFLISFRPLVRTRCPFPPSLRPCFSEVSLHFPPETPRLSISLLRGKREISSSRIESPQLPPPLARRPVPISVPGHRAWEEAARAWAPKKKKKQIGAPSAPLQDHFI